MFGYIKKSDLEKVLSALEEAHLDARLNGTYNLINETGMKTINLIRKFFGIKEHTP